MNDLYGKHINMKLLTKFEYVGDALEEKELLSYCLFVPEQIFCICRRAFISMGGKLEIRGRIF